MSGSSATDFGAVCSLSPAIGTYFVCKKQRTSVLGEKKTNPN